MIDDQADKHNEDFAPPKQKKVNLYSVVGGEDVLIGRPSDDLLTGFGWSRTIRLRRIDQANRQETPRVRDNQRLAQLFSTTILHLYGNQCSTTSNRALNPKGDQKAINLVLTNTPSTDCSFASLRISWSKERYITLVLMRVKKKPRYWLFSCSIQIIRRRAIYWGQSWNKSLPQECRI